MKAIKYTGGLASRLHLGMKWKMIITPAKNISACTITVKMLGY